MKKCPYCAEEIQDEAVKCRYCGERLTDGSPGRGPADTLGSGVTLAAGALWPEKVLAGRYRVVERLGSGGMGEVWKAEDAELGLVVAVKVLPAVLLPNPRSMEALKREAALSLRLTHPNICRLYNFHADGDVKFLVMEYIDGRTLEAALDGRPERRMELEELLPVARQVAAALDYAHAQKPPVLHRDVKPSNIMVTSEGAAKLMDFGIARELKDSMTRVTGRETSGTLLYMSPEQFSGRNPTSASDVYSFAATLYECFAGHPPFYQGAIGHQLLHFPPGPVEGLSSEVNDALLVGLAKEPSERPGDAATLVSALSGSTTRVAPVPAQPKLTVTRDVPKELELDCGGVPMKFVLIPAGEFLMGSPEDDDEACFNEKPQHKVRILRPFYLGAYPVTQAQYEGVMHANPIHFDGAEDPVEQVSWDDAQAFCRELSNHSGRKVRLPTEAEWEYACRAGSRTRYCFGDAEEGLGGYAWYDANSGDRTHPVGRKKPNAWGLFDMHGNVWEWCADRYWEEAYHQGLATDPTGPASGSLRVLRGGSWDDFPGLCRSAYRDGIHPVTRDDGSGGFRAAVDLE